MEKKTQHNCLYSSDSLPSGDRDGSSTAAATAGGFLLMSQEEYQEHQSSITHCRFSHAANMAASIDVDGVVK